MTAILCACHPTARRVWVFCTLRWWKSRHLELRFHEEGRATVLFALGSRTSLLYLPPATCSGALPVVIYLHGAPGDIHEGTNNGWPTTAAKDCFIEVNAKGSILSDGVELLGISTTTPAATQAHRPTTWPN